METLYKTYRQIDKETINTAKNWYKKAHNFATYLANTYKVELSKVCGVISALSPACNWKQNKLDAEKMIVCYISGVDYTTVPFSTYGQNVVKAWMILTDVDRDTLEWFNLKTGAKTYNFYLNILNPNDSNFVTIDRHAIAVYEGRVGKKSGSARLTPKQYQTIAETYKNLAKELGLLPNELQAILWEYHVNLTQ